MYFRWRVRHFSGKYFWACKIIFVCHDTCGKDRASAEASCDVQKSLELNGANTVFFAFLFGTSSRPFRRLQG